MNAPVCRWRKKWSRKKRTHQQMADKSIKVLRFRKIQNWIFCAPNCKTRNVKPLNIIRIWERLKKCSNRDKPWIHFDSFRNLTIDLLHFCVFSSLNMHWQLEPSLQIERFLIWTNYNIRIDHENPKCNQTYLRAFVVLSITCTHTFSPFLSQEIN